ncbi:hypothetical protein A0U93_09280 [Neoasaia chiangmaiensis]|uniref:Uncharacterized protein n=1 Tax=Neoasaia chiangmaiensis TaxID=320497 RepID=A0A1U9KQT2_9PROT|nr:hypothetical protein A0U93_09280 [Neoasaia chiangmaiensis]
MARFVWPSEVRSIHPSSIAVWRAGQACAAYSSSSRICAREIIALGIETVAMIPLAMLDGRRVMRLLSEGA